MSDGHRLHLSLCFTFWQFKEACSPKHHDARPCPVQSSSIKSKISNHPCYSVICQNMPVSRITLSVFYKDLTLFAKVCDDIKCDVNNSCLETTRLCCGLCRVLFCRGWWETWLHVLHLGPVSLVRKAHCFDLVSSVKATQLSLCCSSSCLLYATDGLTNTFFMFYIILSASVLLYCDTISFVQQFTSTLLNRQTLTFVLKWLIVLVIVSLWSGILLLTSLDLRGHNLVLPETLTGGKQRVMSLLL